MKISARIGVHPENIKPMLVGVKCLNCNDEICSFDRHNFVTCKCSKSFVDGGRDYVRAGGDCVTVRHRWVTWQKILASKGIKLYRMTRKHIKEKDERLREAVIGIVAKNFVAGYKKQLKKQKVFDKKLKSVKSQ